MRIEGVICVEGMDLHIDVEVADTASHIYVTNVHPSTLVIPPERLEVAYLAFSRATLTALAAKKVVTLADLVDQQGNLRRMRLPAAAEAEVQQILGALRKAALVFNWNEDATKDLTVISPSLLSSPASCAHDVQSGGADAPHATNGVVDNLPLGEALITRKKGSTRGVLTKELRDALFSKGVKTMADLRSLSEEDLLMTPGFDLEKIAEIKAWLQSGENSSLNEARD